MSCSSLPLGFNIISDLHVDQLRGVDFPRLLRPSPRARYLLVPGDLGNPFHDSYAEFLGKTSLHYEWIVLIAGNHEFWFDPHDRNHVVSVEQKSFSERLAQIRRVCATIANVKFLEREAFVLPGTSVTILGCVLWTNVPSSAEQAVERAMNDYSCIYDDGDTPMLVTVADLRRKHLESLAWLCSAIDAYVEERARSPDTEARLIVMTHHLPSFELTHPHYHTSPINSAYATSLESVCLRPPVALWACGHTHFFRRLEINGVQCIVNASGYEDEDTSVQRGMVYSLE
jgi:predicted phosphodiesterase